MRVNGVNGVCPLLLNFESTDFQELWYTLYASGGHPNKPRNFEFRIVSNRSTEDMQTSEGEPHSKHLLYVSEML
jgi:hypothetical protein